MKLPALVAEFIGTFALIFVGILVIKNLGTAEAGLIGIATAHGLAIACLVSATAAVSGGHLNPAVTFGLYVGKKIDLVTMFTYWVAQLLGGVCAAIAAKFLIVGASTLAVVTGTPSLSKGFSLAQGIVAEAIGTFFLVFVVYGTAVDKRAPKVGGLFIGLTVTMGIYAIGPITGAALNPARWFGPAAILGDFSQAALFIGGPLLGGLLAGLVYAYVLDEKPVQASA